MQCNKPDKRVDHPVPTKAAPAASKSAALKSAAFKSAAFKSLIAGTCASRRALRASQQPREALRRRDGSLKYQSARRPLGLELVVSAVRDPVRRGAVATLLQLGRTLVGWRSVLLLVSAPMGHHRRDPNRSRLFCDRGLAGRLSYIGAQQ